MADKAETLVHPDGREWTPTSPTERTDLIARGWKPREQEGATRATRKTPAKQD